MVQRPFPIHTNTEKGVIVFMGQKEAKQERESRKMDMRRINSPRANRKLLAEEDNMSERGREGSVDTGFYGMNFMRMRKRVVMR